MFNKVINSISISKSVNLGVYTLLPINIYSSEKKYLTFNTTWNYINYLYVLNKLC